MTEFNENLRCSHGSRYECRVCHANVDPINYWTSEKIDHANSNHEHSRGEEIEDNSRSTEFYA